MHCYTLPQIIQLLRSLGPPSSDAQKILSNTLATAHSHLDAHNEHLDFLTSAIKSLGAPWRRLPPELLSDIFIHCLPKDDRLRANDAPFLLTRVCWSWYQAAIAISNLWSNILLLVQSEPCPETLAIGAEYLRISALRAKGAPLRVHLHPAFIAHPASYDLIKKLSPQILSLSIYYPITPDTDAEPISYFSDSPDLSTPNLSSLEIFLTSATQFLAPSDFTHLRHLVQSSHDLKRYIFCCSFPQDPGPIPTTWSTLEELRLTDPMTFTLCSSILRNAPSLRKASFSCLYAVGLPSPSDAHQDGTLNALGSGSSSSILNTTQPYTHPNLETLLIGHDDPAILKFLFDTFTLPRLRNLLLHHWGHAVPPRAWPHTNLMNFLRRSQCLIKTLDLYFELLTPTELIQLLETPSMRDTLTELSVQSDEHFPAIIDEYVLQKLTLPHQPADSDGAAPVGLCPNLEMLGMHSCFAFTMSNFTNMLKSRLDPNFVLFLPFSSSSPSSSTTITTKPKRKYLKYVETDMDPSEAAHNLKSLFFKGLLTVLYDSSPTPQRLPLVDDEKRLLRRYFSEGVVLWEYDPIWGEWGPKDGILDSV